MHAPLPPTPTNPAPAGALLQQLETLCQERGLAEMAERLAELSGWLREDLQQLERTLGELTTDTTPMHRSAAHLLACGGKRLRATCLLLAARLGDGSGSKVRQLAAAAELVHAATLLHDDVVDLGEVRRGQPAARMLWGNNASIYGGDWLLVEALQRVQAAGFPDLLVQALEVLKQILGAEALQLANRGVVESSVADYFSVVEGKTAVLFGWALRAGGRIGGLPQESCQALAEFGRLLGISFQLTDDVLDLDGDPSAVGKSMFSDLREGKITYPLRLALERDPSLAPLLRRGGEELSAETAGKVAAAVRACGAIADTRALARRYSEQAVACLAPLPAGPARMALEQVAIAVVSRES